MFRTLLLPTLCALVIALRLASAQDVNSALGPAPAVTSIFDEIADAVERRAFREVWDASDPRTQRALAERFVDRYPQSIVLKEAYELAARASIVLGNLSEGLEWARRSLRLLPENPSLLVMVADVAAKQSDPELADSSARDALRLLTTAHPPAAMPLQQWIHVRDGLRALAHTVLGRTAALRDRYAEAEQSLLTALTLNAEEIEAAYLLGVVRMAVRRDDDAAPALAYVMKADHALSGPARKLLHQLQDRQSPRPSASFDEYVASLTWRPPAPEPLAPNPPVADRYAGSTACRDCHPRVYERWQATGMAKMFRPYRAEDVIGDFSGEQTVADRARPIRVDGRHLIEIRKGESREWARYPVDYIIGSKWQQAYATKLPDGRFLVLPIQYSRLQATWVNYWSIVDAPGSPRAEISRFHDAPDGAVYQNTCAPCHTSQLKLETSAFAGDATFREGGINCEMCHGPSRRHVDGMKTGASTRPSTRATLGSLRAETETPVRFKSLTADQSVAICAQCHAQSAIHEAQPGGAVNFSEQTRWRRDYATHLLSNFSRSAFYRDGRFRATTFISEALARSQCFRKGDATCVSCHDPHAADAASNPTSLRFSANSDQMCLQCHTRFRDAPERHTRHAAATEASRCVSCHMPKIAEALLFKARSHQIDDVPSVEMTARFGAADSPNACLSCHADRDIAWLRTSMAALFPSR